MLTMHVYNDDNLERCVKENSSCKLFKIRTKPRFPSLAPKPLDYFWSPKNQCYQTIFLKVKQINSVSSTKQKKQLSKVIAEAERRRKRHQLDL